VYTNSVQEQPGNKKTIQQLKENKSLTKLNTTPIEYQRYQKFSRSNTNINLAQHVTPA
jgi:hypothetical protein